MTFALFCRKNLLLLIFIAGVWLLGGCSSAVGISSSVRENAARYYAFFNPEQQFSVASANLLGDYLLTEKLTRSDPVALITELETLYRRSRRQELLTATAETAFFLAQKNRDDRELCVSLLLTSLLHCSAALKDPDRHGTFAPEQVLLMNIGNRALMMLWDYLQKKKIGFNSSFSLRSAGGRQIFFQSPRVELPIPLKMIQEFIPCAGFRVQNLTHSARQFGIGVPLVGVVKKEYSRSEKALYAVQTIPATLLFFPVEKLDIADSEKLTVNLVIADPVKYNFVSKADRCFPLEQDFSTPLAHGASQKPLRHFLLRTLLPEISGHEGLYLLSPRDDRRIPVLLVHGLMSDIRTWLQLINTLQSDPVLRRNYRFMGFSYSSGNPILFSGYLLRAALQEERARMVKLGLSLEQFDKMVVIGHSMGGLLSRLAVSSSSEENLNQLMGRERFELLKKNLKTDELGIVGRSAIFSPFPSVKRVVFMAAPHRGSAMAKRWYARLGTALIRVPVFLRNCNEKIIAALLGIGEKSYAEELRDFNGISNLVPDGMALKLINTLALPSIPFHSVIGNTSGNFPGGSDGVVAYRSSHLDGAASELVVQSGHSVQQNPLAIQEVRRILLEHINHGKSGGKLSPGVLDLDAKNAEDEK